MSPTNQKLQEIFEKLEIKKTKYLFFYPTIWAHKNHIFIRSIEFT